MLDVRADISDTQTAQYCHNELLLSAYITTSEYVAYYITLLFQKVILQCNTLLGVT